VTGQARSGASIRWGHGVWRITWPGASGRSQVPAAWAGPAGHSASGAASAVARSAFLTGGW
jgi:hypothetical protein